MSVVCFVTVIVCGPIVINDQSQSMCLSIYRLSVTDRSTRNCGTLEHLGAAVALRGHPAASVRTKSTAKAQTDDVCIVRDYYYYYDSAEGEAE